MQLELINFYCIWMNAMEFGRNCNSTFCLSQRKCFLNIYITYVVMINIDWVMIFTSERKCTFDFVSGYLLSVIFIIPTYSFSFSLPYLFRNNIEKEKNNFIIILVVAVHYWTLLACKSVGRGGGGEYHGHHAWLADW